MFVQGIKPLSNNYNCRKPAFGSAGTAINSGIGRNVAVLGNASKKVAEKATPVQYFYKVVDGKIQLGMKEVAPKEDKIVQKVKKTDIEDIKNKKMFDSDEEETTTYNPGDFDPGPDSFSWDSIQYG